MENNKEKFLSLSTKETSKDILEEAKYYVENSEFIRFSNNIALLILDRLDHLKWTQKQLAEKMAVSPQQVSKWVKGGENLTISTIINIGNALDFKLISLNEPPKAKIVSETVHFSGEYSSHNRSAKINFKSNQLSHNKRYGKIEFVKEAN